MRAILDRPNILLGLLLLVTFLVYAKSLGNDYVYDDRTYVMVPNDKSLPNPMVGELQDLGTYFGSVYGAGVIVETRGYRPVTVLSFALVQWAFGRRTPNGNVCSPGWHHLINVFTHLVNVVLAFHLIRSCAGPTDAESAGSVLAPLAGAAVFALAAIRSDPVISIVGRAETLAFAFGAGATLLYLLGLRRRFPLVYYVLPALCLFLAFGSKESAIAWAVLLPLIVLVANSQTPTAPPLRSQVPRLLTTIALPLLCFVPLWTTTIAKSLETFEQAFERNPLWHVPIFDRLRTAVVVLGFALYKILVPFPLACDYSHPVFEISTSFADARFWFSFVVLLTILALGLWSFRTRPFLFLAMATFLGMSFATSNLPVPIETIFGERLMYTPAFGLSWLAAWVVWRNPKPIVLGILLAWLVANGVQIVNRCFDWHDNRYLFMADRKNQPRSLSMVLAVAGIYRKEGEQMHFQGPTASYREKWLEQLEYGRKLVPDSPLVLNDMAAWYIDTKQDYATAEKLIQEALASEQYLEQRDGRTLYWLLGYIADKRGQVALAEKHYRRAVKANPTDYQNLRDLAYFLERHGRPGEARTIFASAYEFAPQAGLELLRIAELLGDTTTTERLLQELPTKGVQDVRLFLYHGLLLKRRRDCRNAIPMLDRALRALPLSRITARGRVALAVCLAATGQRDAAHRIAQEMLQFPDLDPESRREAEGLL